MKIYVTLETNAGILDSIAIDTKNDDDDTVSKAIWNELIGVSKYDRLWKLAPGDTIKITDRE